MNPHESGFLQMNTSSFIFIKNEISKIQKSSREIERIEMTPAKKENFDAQKTTETNCKSDRATEILCLIIKNQTVSSISNQSAFTGIIKDYYKGEYKREVTVLVKSIEENIPQDLLAKKDKIPFSVLFAQCVQRLEDCGFSKEMSIWAVHAWARALGIEKF